jgi:serine/threonine protein phosphatase 1
MSATNSRRIFIGDVHGHYVGLMALLEAIAPDANDQIYFLGDLIDRGPDSAKVVGFVKHSPYFCVLGNHELLMLDSFAGGQICQPDFQAWLYSGGQETLESYENYECLFEHLDWMQALPMYLDLGDIWLVHAGLHPTLPLKSQTVQEFCWIRSEFHRMTQPYFRDKLIVTGHTITFTFPGVEPGQIAQGEGWLDIDTGAYHRKSGWMTALDVTQQLVYQVNVFERTTRTRHLSEAVTRVNPDLVKLRR